MSPCTDYEGLRLRCDEGSLLMRVLRVVEKAIENQKKGSRHSRSYSTEYFLRRILFPTQRKRVYDERSDKRVLVDHTKRKVAIQHKIASIPKGRLVVFKSRIQVVVETVIDYDVHNTMEK